MDRRTAGNILVRHNQQEETAVALGFLSKLFGGSTKSPGKQPSRTPVKAERSPETPPPEPESFWWDTLENDQAREAAEPVDLPVDPDLLHAQLERKIEENTLTMIEIPANILRIVNIMNDPDFQYASVANLVSQSPVLAADFLRVANSAVYSRGTPMNDIRVALPRLGVTTVQGMLYMHATRMKLASNPLFKDLATAIVENSLQVAVISKYLSLRYYPDPDQAFMAGLLHNIGRLAVLQELSAGKTLPDDTDTPLQMEQFDRAFDFAPRIGGMIAEYWNLEKETAYSILHHADLPPRPETEDEDADLGFSLACLTNFSLTVARMLGFGPAIGTVDLFELRAAEELGIHREDQDALRFLNEIPSVLSNQTTAG